MTIEFYKDRFSIIDDDEVEKEKNILSSRVHKTKIEKNREYYLKKKDVYYCCPMDCFCGSTVTMVHYNRHCNSNKHLKFLQHGVLPEGNAKAFMGVGKTVVSTSNLENQSP